MKKILFSLLILANIGVSAQTKYSCCSPNATEKFAMFASNEKFAAAHRDPLPLQWTPEKGSMIDIKAKDGKYVKAFIVKADQKTNNWIIVFHEWWGLNNYIKKEAEKLQREIPNSNVIAVDLYDGQVAEVKEDAQKLMSGLQDEGARATIAGAIEFTGSNTRIFTIGWCMGGGWSMQGSLMAGRQAGGCVIYYGMPETDRKKLANLNCDVLGIFAKKDGWINDKVVSQFEQDMKAVKKKLTVKVYDADHAFANPSNPDYNEADAENAHAAAISFLKERIK